MTDTTYNGWTNHATWNVALWIGGDEGLRPSKLITKIEDQLNLIGEINQATIDQHLEAFSEEPVKILNRSRHLIIARN